MYDIRWIRENRQAFDDGLARRGIEVFSDELIALDERRRSAIAALEAAQARRNAASKEIGEAKKRKDEAAAKSLMDEVAGLKAKIPALEEEEKAASAALETALAQVPNLPLDDVPDGKDEEDNVEHHRFGAKRDYDFTPKQHFELGEALRQMDFEAAAKLSGSRFVVLRAKLARLERALAQFMLDLHTTEHGYTEVSPPLMVRDDAMFGTAQLPKFKEDQFAVYRETTIEDRENRAVERTLNELAERGIAKEWVGEKLDRLHATATEEARQQRMWLIPTAEVPLTNLVREKILDEEVLPLRLTAGTYCFRAEAGAAGRDTRGMIRQHQFYKVELVSVTTPEASRDEHERLLACAEEVLKRLGLHYRVVTLCTGDMGFASQKTYDIEVWLPGQGLFREISSCSVCGEFQARRMGARYRTKEGRAIRPVHTLNGSGVAVGRAMIAVMENYQQADGSIVVPDVLRPYMGGLDVIKSE
ncbi:Seryl-tRNA synthetase [Rhodovulum sp. PH10]|uniref:serine--tRNA ligase n=1 Tax=Rhodovulum sp. PH10 TaxID=1187851 RepID=UPI00027C28EB|nr:serine--tRNA ligase [Rhodovulum sp. PH10]EJW12195.1 Seryl-tRNA synthetase [Rhodovulum sp. PH10]